MELPADSPVSTRYHQMEMSEIPDTATIETDSSFLDINLVQSVEFVQLTDTYLFLAIRIVFIDYDHILVYTDGSVINFTDSDTSYVFVIIDGADQYLCAGFRITFWCRNIVQNRLEQWNLLSGLSSSSRIA